MKTLLILIVFLFSIKISAQVEESKTASQSKTSKTIKTNSFNDDPYFSINFNSVPKKTTNEIPTDVGSVTMVSYMIENPTVAYMVAYSSYPVGQITSENSDMMLENAVGGFIQNLSMTMVEQKTISLDNHKGILFKANSELFYAIVADYLVNNTLFQIGIMRSDRFPSQIEIDDFIYSFQLKK